MFADDSQVIDYHHKPQFTPNLQTRLDTALKLSGRHCTAAMFRFLTFCLCEVMPMRKIIKLALAGLLSVYTCCCRGVFARGVTDWLSEKQHQFGAGEKLPNAGKTLSAKQNLRVEFPAGPQMLEALNVGSIDLGSTGDIPPIFAQAAGADLLWCRATEAKSRSDSGGRK